MTGLVLGKLGKLARLWYKNFLSPSEELLPFKSRFPCMGGGISDGLRYYFKHFPPQKTSYDFEQNTFSMPSICEEKSYKCVVWLRIFFWHKKSNQFFVYSNKHRKHEVKVCCCWNQALFLSIFLPRNYFKLKWEEFPMSGK